MKKIIALLLVLSMVLSFAACGKKDEPVVTVPIPTQPAIVETEPAPVETEPVIEETEPVIEEPVITEPEVPVVETLAMPTPELPADEAVVADKQKTYEKVFNEGLFIMDTNSVTMNFANLFKMSILADPEGKSLLTFSGSIEGAELAMSLYTVSETEAYFNTKSVESGVEVNEWYKIEGSMTDENGESTVGGLTTSTDSLTEFQDSIQSVTYIGIIDDKDAVELEYVVQDEMTGTNTTTKVVLLLDAETYNVFAMYMEQDGMLVVADFTPVEDLDALCEIPDDLTATMTAEDAGMELAMGMMMFIFAAADAGLE